jgi:hypothetical protein
MLSINDQSTSCHQLPDQELGLLATLPVVVIGPVRPVTSGNEIPIYLGKFRQNIVPTRESR